MLLRDNTAVRKDIKDNMDFIFAILLDIEDDEALCFVNWFKKHVTDTIKNAKHIELVKQIKDIQPNGDRSLKEKIEKMKKKLKNYVHKEYPNDIKAGDILSVDYGSGYCNELSNEHYGVVLSEIKGSMYLVAPLTSKKPEGEILYFDNLGLPSKDKNITRSYVRFNQIRFLHYRRITKLKYTEPVSLCKKDVIKILEILNDITEYNIDMMEKIVV